MRWTTEKPTQPGWYWWRNKNQAARVVEIVDDGEESVIDLQARGYALAWRVKNLKGQWAGPLEPPT